MAEPASTTEEDRSITKLIQGAQYESQSENQKKLDGIMASLPKMIEFARNMKGVKSKLHGVPHPGLGRRQLEAMKKAQKNVVVEK